ncbi:FAD-dependent oxidoreductase [Variovorax gracilis]|uniref:FAD-dependent oxidoreductase n=1 Tax=Variovorax gracilis TaxID=3053502 RepID=UPI00336BE88B
MDLRGIPRTQEARCRWHRCEWQARQSALCWPQHQCESCRLGATRVMATCAVMGEAAGTAAAICLDLVEEH